MREGAVADSGGAVAVSDIEKGYGDVSLSWSRHDGAKERGSLWINCNDFFFWGCADAEDVTPENFPVLLQAMSDADLAGDASYGGLLFCARVRQVRPQGCCYPGNRSLWPLFDACGPEREIDTGNPYHPGGGLSL